MHPENYPERFAHNFAILPTEQFNAEAKSYFDFNSIMLYSPSAGSTGGPTWEPRNGDWEMSSNDHVMSRGDIETLNSLYPKKFDDFCYKPNFKPPTVQPTPPRPAYVPCPIPDFSRVSYNLCFANGLQKDLRKKSFKIIMKPKKI